MFIELTPEVSEKREMFNLNYVYNIYETMDNRTALIFKQGTGLPRITVLEPYDTVAKMVCQIKEGDI
jgi:hypothetical protein